MRSSIVQRTGFVLFETILALTIFALGVIALGRCVENCIAAEVMKESDARARRALESRLAEIEAGVVNVAESSTEDLKGAWQGMTLKTKRTPLKEKNEKDQEILGIFLVELELNWKTGVTEQSRSIEFYHFPRK